MRSPEGRTLNFIFKGKEYLKFLAYSFLWNLLSFIITTIPCKNSKYKIIEQNYEGHGQGYKVRKLTQCTETLLFKYYFVVTGRAQ